MERGVPGRLRMRAVPLIPASCRERMAVGTCRREIARICSPKPGSSRVMTRRVASGVTSRGVGPVPPVVMMREHPRRSVMSHSCDSSKDCSSGTILYSASHCDVTLLPKNCRIAGLERQERGKKPEQARAQNKKTATRQARNRTKGERKENDRSGRRKHGTRTGQGCKTNVHKEKLSLSHSVCAYTHARTLTPPLSLSLSLCLLLSLYEWLLTRHGQRRSLHSHGR